MPLYQYILRRLVLIVPLLFGISLIAFAISHAVPSDPVAANLGQKAMSDPGLWPLSKRNGASTNRSQNSTSSMSAISCAATWAAPSRAGARSSRISRPFCPPPWNSPPSPSSSASTVGMVLGLASAMRRNTWVDHTARVASAAGRQHTRLLAGPARAVYLLCRTGLGRRPWSPGRGHGAAAPFHRLLYHRLAAGGRLGALPQRRLPPHAAFHRARQLSPPASSRVSPVLPCWKCWARTTCAPPARKA